MNTAEALQSLLIASILAAFLVVPCLADDSAQLPQSQEPVYVWQGNRIAPPAAPNEAPAATVIQGESDLPQAVEQGSVRYITGGIGQEERDALQAVKNDYNLHVISTNAAGEFDGDTHISIFDRKGDELLNASAGPMFYAKLPAGTYTIKASSDSQSERRKVTVGGGKPSSVYLRWS